ncbi:MAG: hypothetical protein AAF804_20380 [Bacteroidota bacterium]
MKKPSFFSQLLMSLALASILALAACTPEQTQSIAEEDQDLAQLDAMVEADFEAVDQIGYEAMDEAFGRSYQSAGLISPCVVVTHDSVLKVLTLDFGTGCLGPDGKTRAGKIIIDYTKRLWWPGASLTIALDSFHVEGVQIEGTKTHTNLANTFNDPITINSTLVGGKVTWPDGSMATRDFDRTRTWDRAANPASDQLIVTGTASGTRKDGSSFSATILTPKVYKRSCRAQGILVATEGVTSIQRSGKPDLTVDFGNGACDSEITLSVGNQSTTIVL